MRLLHTNNKKSNIRPSISQTLIFPERKGKIDKDCKIVIFDTSEPQLYNHIYTNSGFMIKKDKEKIEAIRLRKEGFSYNEILSKVPIAKSTLSLWLRNIGIAKKQSQILTEKRKLAQVKAQEACRQARILRETFTIETAKKEIRNVSQRELWLIGASIYWAEGSKQKTHNVSQGVSFGNYDYRMVALFNRWLRDICNLQQDEISYSIYIHKTANREKVRDFWEKILNTKIEKIYFKNHNPKTNRRNTEENYHGLLRMDVKRSTNLNRKISGWILGITETLKI
jgi:hypothetical protein